MQDFEVDDVQRFFDGREAALSQKAGLAVTEDAELSDEEVLGLGSASDVEIDASSDDALEYYGQTDAAIREKRARSSREQELNWGEAPDNYFGGEDDVGVEDGASDEEEQEALRLREQDLELMHESDFVDGDAAGTWNVDDERHELARAQPAAIDPRTLGAAERRALVAERFPALLLLGRELVRFAAWEKAVAALPAPARTHGETALRVYKACCLTFFALFYELLQKNDLSLIAKVEEHPVNEGLLAARQLWVDFQAVYLPSNDKSAASSGSAKGKKPAVQFTPVRADAGLVGHRSGESQSAPAPLHKAAAAEESDGMLSDAEASDSDSGLPLSPELDVQDSASDASEDEFSIQVPAQRALPTAVADFDEAADSIEQQARAKNKQSLRFYSSQISKAEARQAAAGGDVDLPYAERDFERRQRLLAEAQQRGREAPDALGGDDYDGYDGDEGDAGDGDGAGSAYYASTVANKKAAKAAVREQHAQAARAAKEGRLEEYLAQNAHVDKRALNYQIEKNKGLTRKRKKENRNARVKKRVRYEDAQKRLKGVRRVYTGSQGAYGGEETGIRKNLAHSRRFNS